MTRRADYSFLLAGSKTVCCSLVEHISQELPSSLLSMPHRTLARVARRAPFYLSADQRIGSNNRIKWTCTLRSPLPGTFVKAGAGISGCLIDLMHEHFGRCLLMHA